MISAWHLLWIVPLCTFTGMMLTAILKAGNDER